MTTDVTIQPDPEVTCASCEACCCRLQVMLLTETGVPEQFIEKTRGQIPVFSNTSEYCVLTPFIYFDFHPFLDVTGYARVKLKA